MRRWRRAWASLTDLQAAYLSAGQRPRLVNREALAVKHPDLAARRADLRARPRGPGHAGPPDAGASGGEGGGGIITSRDPPGRSGSTSASELQLGNKQSP